MCLEIDCAESDKEGNGGDFVKDSKTWCQASIAERIKLRRVTREWRGTEVHICRYGDVDEPNEREGSVSDSFAVLERWESDWEWFVVRGPVTTDQVEVFKQGAFPEDIQHVSRR